MNPNVGSADKLIRIILGVAIIIAGIFFQSWWGLVGVVPLMTALMNFCPAYSLLGISTKTKIKTEKIKV
ncbi:MAG: DUF2892 domain-containing protein [Ignavibacteriales bacterium]|nr:MAG: DUF2892 domain-containing protein [Ignavibacteriales bacterium]